MKKFTITVNDGFYPSNLTGEFYAKSKAAAIRDAKDYYAQELDTYPEKIKIIEIKKEK
jgi:hypothetical protein